MLVFCELPKPLQLLQKFLDVLVDDFRFRHPDCPEHLLQNFALLQIENELAFFSRRLSDFSLPNVSDSDCRQLRAMSDYELLSKHFCSETDFSYQELAEFVELCCGTETGSLNQSQRAVFDFVVSKVRSCEQCLLFIDARGGTGKTYTLNAILAAARTMHKNVVSPALALATSGIAATQLKGGRTFHSKMRAPLVIKEHSAVLDISVQHYWQTLLRSLCLLFGMRHRWHIGFYLKR